MWRQQAGDEIEGKHIASLTHSEMLVLNLPELQGMGTFTIEIALLDQPEPKIYAYQQQESQNSYILVIPLALFESTKNHSKSFVQLLCLCSSSVTFPSHGHYQQQIESLLTKFRVGWRERRGNSVVKLYLQDHCLNSYLDLVTFQAVQFKSSIDELISMKRENAYQYCINSFREELLPYIYQNEEDSIAQALELCLNELKDIYIGLECTQRFDRIFSAMNPNSQSSLKRLQEEIASAVVSRNITTVGDEECEELINQELSRLVEGELLIHEKELGRMKASQQMVFLTKIMSNLLVSLREYNFEVNDQKFLFLNSKIIEKAFQLQRSQVEKLQADKDLLANALELKEKEIKQLKRQLSSESQKESAKLQIITEEPQLVLTTRIHPENLPQTKTPLSLQDLKEPLQPVNANVNGSKLRKTGLTKTKEKLKEGLKRQQQIRKQRSTKNLRGVT